MRTRSRCALLKCVLSIATLIAGAPSRAEDAVITMSCGALANTCMPTENIKIVATIAVASNATAEVKAAAQGNADTLLATADYQVFDRDDDQKKLKRPAPLPTNIPGERLIDLRMLLTSQSDELTRSVIYGKGGTSVGLRLQVTAAGKEVNFPFTLDMSSVYRDGTVGLILSNKAPYCEPKAGKPSLKNCEFNSVLVLPIENFSQWAAGSGLQQDALTLYLNDVAMSGVTGLPEPVHTQAATGVATATVNEGARMLRFKLTRDLANAASTKAWNDLLASDVSPTIALKVGLGTGAKRWSFSSGTVTFELRRSFMLPLFVGIAVLALVIILGLLPRMDTKFSTLRTVNVLVKSKVAYDALPTADRQQIINDLKFEFKTPHSLSRIQMAFWIFTVTFSFFALWFIVDGGHHLLNSTALALMGISATSMVLAQVIDMATEDDVKIDTALETALTGFGANPKTKQIADVKMEYASAQAAGLLTTNRVLRDIFAEKGTTRLDLHRIQLGCFTVFYLVVFVLSLNKLMALPEFSTNTLALLGISSASYLGYKFGVSK